MGETIRKNAVPRWLRAGLAQGGFKSLEAAMANELFRHIETKPNAIQSKRVEHILENLARLGRNKWDLIAFNQLRQPLERYKWRYRLLLSRDLSSTLDFTKEMSEEDEWEHRAVRFLISLVPHHINRLRRCAYDGCKGWFFAEKRSDQEFCKRGACRQNYYDSDPKRRERKSAKMRENRNWHRQQEQRAKAKAKKSRR